MMSACYPHQYYSCCLIGFTEWSPIVPINPLYTVPVPIPIIVNPTPNSCCLIGFTEWSPIVPINPLYTVPVPIPIIVNPTPNSCCLIGFTEWSPIVPINPLYTVPVPIPIIVNPTPILSTPSCSYILVPPVIASTIAPVISFQVMNPSSSYQSISKLESPRSFHVSDNVIEVEYSIEYYLSLPKDLFPSARMVTFDPNVIIEEFCRLSNVYSHVPWILDLEFGIPKYPITRPIPCYNVKYNSIHCKNTPDAIHPGFESCSQDFKRVLLFYYDCIVSAWYRGYVFLNCDKSVENFQSWLTLPMQELGMCWS